MRSVTRSNPTFQSIFGMYPFRTRREVLSKQTVADSYFKNPDIPLLFTRDTSPNQNKFKQNLRQIVRVRNRNNDLKTNIPLKYEETQPNLYLNRHRLKQPGKICATLLFLLFEYKHRTGPFCRKTKAPNILNFPPLRAAILLTTIKFPHQSP